MTDSLLRIAILYPELPAARGLQFQLRSAPRFQVVYVTQSREQLLASLLPLDVDAVVVSSDYEGGGSIPVSQEVEIFAPQVGTLVRMRPGGGAAAKRLLQRGAAGCVLEDDAPEVLHEAAQLVAEGGTFISSRAAFALLGIRRLEVSELDEPARPNLSKREKDVMRAILDERTTAEIAEALQISFGTVETHRRNMLAKVGARNTAGLVRYCFELALLE